MCTVNLLEKDLLFPLSLWLQNESFSRSRSRTSFCETCWRKYWPVEVSKAIFRVDIRRALSQKEKNTVVFDGLPVSFPQPSSTFCGFFSYQQSLLIKKKKISKCRYVYWHIYLTRAFWVSNLVWFSFWSINNLVLQWTYVIFWIFCLHTVSSKVRVA